MKAKKNLLIMTMMICILCSSCIRVNAAETTESTVITETSEVMSLDEIISQNKEQEEIKQEQVENVVITEPVDKEPVKQEYVSAESFIESLGDAGKISTEVSPTAEKVNESLSKIVTPIVQILSYGIVICLTVVIVLDLTYIVIPFTRGILLNGRVQPAPSSGMSEPSMGGFTGLNRGPMASGFGGMNGGYNNSLMQNNQPASSGNNGSVCFVTENAIRAVQAEGTGKSPLRIYAKSMIVVLVATPILLVLAISGVLMDLGFVLGDTISAIIAAIGSML